MSKASNGKPVIAKFFGDLANRTSQAAGRASTFILAAGIVVLWAVSGPLFGFSDTWQLVINTGTTIVTFLMVFLIQNSQNRDSAAIQVKLDELIRVGAARNSLVGIEHLTDDELEDLRTKCEARAQPRKQDGIPARQRGRPLTGRSGNCASSPHPDRRCSAYSGTQYRIDPQDRERGQKAASAASPHIPRDRLVRWYRLFLRFSVFRGSSLDQRQFSRCHAELAFR